ncbi:putative small multi-drug export protein [Alicyclobacillus sacchari]|uniref:Putative small multi-drug export protein n=2 Tax=Alicyclobacillus sacchari TaxID=392010 RepID=A0A4R8LUM8_9BACL|nr:putative small multi-drug export protein [Alicyclobacillus sacchari]
MGRQMGPTAVRSAFVRGLMYGVAVAFVFFAAALGVGISQGKVVPTLSLIGTSIVLEAQPAAAASIPLGFQPFTGAVISILANLISLPIMMFAFGEIVHRWKWARKRLQKAERLSQKYGRYGVWILIPLCPILGAYVCMAIGYLLRWNTALVVTSILIGMISSTFIIAYGGWAIVGLFR